MASTILGSLLPVVVTFLLGFLAARRHDFSREHAAVLNRLVLGYALPLMLFVGTVGTPRAELREAVPLVITFAVAIVVFYGVVLLFFRRVLAVRTRTSALIALTASAPAVPFMGPAILGNLFGPRSALPMVMASLVINLTVVPFTILFLTLDPAEEGSEEKSPAVEDAEHGPTRPAGFSAVAGSLWKTVREPLVWAPVVALGIVLSGLRIPRVALQSLSLLGHASGGVSLFAAGIMLASVRIKATGQVLALVALKNAVQPALVLGGLRWLGSGNLIRSEAVLTTAIPAMPIVVMLALQYHVAEAVVSSALFFSVIGSVITLAVFIALTG